MNLLYVRILFLQTVKLFCWAQITHNSRKQNIEFSNTKNVNLKSFLRYSYEMVFFVLYKYIYKTMYEISNIFKSLAFKKNFNIFAMFVIEKKLFKRYYQTNT